MSSAIARLSTNETNEAANSLKAEKESKDGGFDPTSGARGVPGRGMTPDVRGGDDANRTAASQRTVIGDGDSDVSDEDIGDLGLDDGNAEANEDAADFKNNLAKMDPLDVFNEFDTDGSGNISFEEFRAMLPRLGIKMSVPKMLKYFRMCDADGSGEIDFTEFKIALFACDPDSGNPVGFSPNALLTPLDAFEMFDEDGTGKIDEDEFFFVLEYLGLQVSDEKQEELFQKYDKDQSGYIDYAEFKQVWVRCANTKKELLDRGIALPKFATKAQLMRMLEHVLDEEEEKERLALAEADRWRKWQAIITSKNKFIAKAKRRAAVELRSALDAAGQVYVFGGGTFNQFCGFHKKDMSTASYKQDGFEQMQTLWFRRVRPGQGDGFIDQIKGEMQEVEMPSEEELKGLGIEDPRVEAATSAFHGINAQVNTCALWGKRTKEVAISDNVIFALTDLGEIFSWGGNDHWWHEVEPDSYWQNNWRGDSTERSKMLLMTHNKKEPEEEEARNGDSPEDIEANKLKLVVQYFGHWRPPPGAQDRLTYIKGDLLPLVKYEEVQLSLSIRGKPADGMTKNEMIDILHKDFVLEKKVLGERAHRKIRELELEIMDLTKRKKKTMANKIKLEVNDMWRPLKEIQAEEIAQENAKNNVERQAKYSKFEEGYEKWFQHINKSRENAHPEFTPRGNSYKFEVSGITERGNEVKTPRGYASCVSIIAGSNHAGVIHQNGQLYMWGMGVSGRLGLDDTEGGDPRADTKRPTLVQALQGKPVVRASCGYSHSAAIVSGGELYIWGGASSGKLGLGKLTSNQECYCSVPTRLHIPRVKKVRRVSCGANHSACVGNGGELYVWGCGDGGRLGLGKDNMITQFSPVLVSSLEGEKFGNVSCGYFQTIALTAVKDAISGQGGAKLKSLSGGKIYVAGPANVLGKFCPIFQDYEVLRASPGQAAVVCRHVSAGFGHQVAVSSEGELLCWGNNANGCCGQNVESLFVPEPMAVKCLYEAPKNLAAGKAARQSSIYGDLDAFIAVDGKTEGVMTDANCIHTQQDAQPWWEVDMNDYAVINTIKLWNRTDEPADMSMPRDKFTSRLFPVWIMISTDPFPDGVGGDNLRKCLDMCVARIRIAEDKRMTVWQVPDNITGRYVRVQLEGFNFLHFAQLEVFGVFGINKSVGRVNYAVAGKNVTAAVIRPSADPRDIETAYKRAIASDSYNADILRQFETYALEYGKNGRGDTKNKMATCLLCKGGQMCETCTMKWEHREELARLPLGPGGRLRRLESISAFLLDAEKPPLDYTPKPIVEPPTIMQGLGNGVKKLFGFGKKNNNNKGEEEGEGEEGDDDSPKKGDKKGGKFSFGRKKKKKKKKKKGEEDEEEDGDGEDDDEDGDGDGGGNDDDDDDDEEEEEDDSEEEEDDDDNDSDGEEKKA